MYHGTVEVLPPVVIGGHYYVVLQVGNNNWKHLLMDN